MSKKRQMMGRAMMSCSTQGIKWEGGRRKNLEELLW